MHAEIKRTESVCDAERDSGVDGSVPKGLAATRQKARKRMNSGLETWGAIAFIGVVVVALVYSCLNMPTSEDCRREADRRGIPCEYHSVHWDEDECECMHSTDHYEIEFELPSQGCNY